MNIGHSRQTPPKTMLPPGPEREGSASEHDLNAILRSAGFAAVAPRLQRLMEGLAEAGNNVPAILSRNVSHLQDVFVDALYEALAERGVDLSHKITLRLNARGELFCANAHPEAERLNALAAENPALSSVFAEIALQSAALRDIYSLHCLLQAGQAGSAAYQLSLQGEMSHFHFC